MRIAITALLAGIAGTVPSATPARAQTDRLTARQVLERIKTNVGVPWAEQTVDTFKDGDPDTPVTGIAVTMMATLDVLQRAAASGANFIISHEPTFYGHLDQIEPLEKANDAVTCSRCPRPPSTTSPPPFAHDSARQRCAWWAIRN
jgi:hypothetical protein